MMSDRSSGAHACISVISYELFMCVSVSIGAPSCVMARAISNGQGSLGCCMKASKLERAVKRHASCKALQEDFLGSASFLTETSVRSPRKLFIFIICKNVFRIKVSKKEIHLISKQEALFLGLSAQDLGLGLVTPTTPTDQSASMFSQKPPERSPDQIPPRSSSNSDATRNTLQAQRK